jgi:hypothetical protein
MHPTLMFMSFTSSGSVKMRMPSTRITLRGSARNVFLMRVCCVKSYAGISTVSPSLHGQTCLLNRMQRTTAAHPPDAHLKRMTCSMSRAVSRELGWSKFALALSSNDKWLRSL